MQDDRRHLPRSTTPSASRPVTDAADAREAVEGPQSRLRRDRQDQPQLLHAGRLRPAEHARRGAGAIDEIGKEYGLQINNVFHAGDGNVHPIFLYDDRDEAQVQNMLACRRRSARNTASTSAAPSPASTASASRRSTSCPTCSTSRRWASSSGVKDAFDPEQRINAGKLIPSDKVKVTLLKPGRHVPQ